MYKFLKNNSIIKSFLLLRFCLFYWGFILIFGLFLNILFNFSSTAKSMVNSNINQLNDEFAKFNTNFKNYNQKITLVNNLSQNIVEFNVAIANSPQKQQYGLMNLKYLPPNLGMLFIKDRPQKIYMWMKNTTISLDMIFFDENYRVNHIAPKAIPYSLEIISSPEKSLGVIELNAGIAKKFNIKNGDKIIINN